MQIEDRDQELKSVRQAIEIIEYILDHDGANVNDLDNNFALAKSSIYNYLYTLEKHNFVSKKEDDYQIGLKLLLYGKAAKNSTEIVEVSKTSLLHLAENTENVAWLVVEEGGESVFVHKEETDEAIQSYGRIGKRSLLHVTAAGQAILACMNRSKVEEIIDLYGLQKQTEYTITDEDTLFEKLDSIKEQGYAISDQAAALGVISIAAPIIVDGQPKGSISVFAIKDRADEAAFKSQAPDIISRTADQIAEEYSSIYN